MKTLKFEGHSDDTFGEYGVAKDDYDNCASGTPIRWKVEADGVGVIVSGQYSPDNTGTWSIGVAMLDEDQNIAWPMRVGFEGYTTTLEIDAPDNVTVICMEREDDE